VTASPSSDTRPPGPPPETPEECDVVMKGGITSGVVYPTALWVLSERYRFNSVGGASAGAIAAVIAAAAQYGDERDEQGRLAQLHELATTLNQPHFVERLFQPYTVGRGPYRVLLSFVSDHHSLRFRLLKLLGRIVVNVWPAVIAAAAAAWALWSYGYQGAGAVPAVVLIFLALVVFAPVVFVLRLIVALSAARGFGLCPGTTQPGYKTEALLDWIHAEVQRAAGRTTEDPPLTFADLEEKGIRLELMTTDLNAGRPVRLPLLEPAARPPSSRDYVFNAQTLNAFLPQPLQEWLAGDAVAPSVGENLRQLPGMDLPVAFAARLSLSFPVLLSAIPLYARTAADVYEPRLFSDGGISSNFPIHFFDGWLPTRPTFGLDLIGPDPDATTNVVMPSGPFDPLPRRWIEISNLKGFGHQIFDSARNWRDTLQMELPGFRERVCHIRLSSDEGGLNLNMKPPTIRALVDRGEQAGLAILAEFCWPREVWERFRIFAALLERGLQTTGQPANWAPYQQLLARTDFAGFDATDATGEQWRTAASTQLRTLLDQAATWQQPTGVSLGAGELPTPFPAMRITPDV
jgi:hypothetical protein